MVVRMTKYVMIVMVVSLLASPAMGYLKLHPDNHRYFEETQTGEAVVITGHGAVVPCDGSLDFVTRFHEYPQTWRMQYVRDWHFTPWSAKSLSPKKKVQLDR